MAEKTFAILVDGENVKAEHFSNVLAEVEKLGAVAIKWVYADWTAPNSKAWQNVLEITASRPKQQFHYTKKDDADHALIMDAIELININSRVNAICLVTSDGGFASLAQRIREYGVYSMVIGEKKSPERLIRACENFVDVENLKNVSSNNSNLKNDLDSLLLDAFKRCSNDSDEAYLGDFGTALKRVDPSFDFRNYQVGSLKKLIKSKNELFEITKETNDRCYFKRTLEEIQEGKIDKIMTEKGFGFVINDFGRFFIHKSEFTNLNDWNKVNKGTKLGFQAEKKQETNGKEARALNIFILED